MKIVALLVILSCVAVFAGGDYHDDDCSCDGDNTINFNFEGLIPKDYACCEDECEPDCEPHECPDPVYEDCPDPCQPCPDCHCPDCQCDCPTCPDCYPCDYCCPDLTCEDCTACDQCEDYEGDITECCPPECPPDTYIWIPTDADRSGDTHSFWFNCATTDPNNGETGVQRYSFQAGADFSIFDSDPRDVAVLSGDLTLTSGPGSCVPGNDYYVQITMIEVLDESSITIKGNNNNWRFFSFLSGEMTQTDCTDDCASFEIVIAPQDPPYAFQVGPGANLKNAKMGASTWISLIEDLGEGYRTIVGDINIDLELVCPEPTEP